MKILKIIGLAIVGIIAVVLLVAAFVSGDVKYEKSVLINAPVDSVWMNTNSLTTMAEWSPWNDKDPNMKITMTGEDGTVGSKSCWESDNEDVGRGCQTITSLNPPNLIETDLKFYDPYESEAKGYVLLVAEGEGTKVTWGFASIMPYPFRITKLFMNLEDMLEDDFSVGLNKLKTLSEN